MPWVMLDDHFDEHRKIAQVGPLGMALFVAGLCYCNRNLTDGHIPWAHAKKLLAWEFLDSTPDERGYKVHTIAVTCGMRGDDVNSQLVIDLLLEAGLWEIAEDGGYTVHDYDQYQKSRAEVEAQRAEWAAHSKQRRDVKRESKVDSKQDSTVESHESPRTPIPIPIPDSQSQTEPEQTRVASARKRTSLSETPEFVAFYDAYPRKAARPEALKAWNRAMRDGCDPAAIMAGLERYKRSQDPQYYAHPATWLNQRRWEDEPLPLTGNNGHDSHISASEDAAIQRGIEAARARYG